jgi:hypothetical protein
MAAKRHSRSLLSGLQKSRSGAHATWRLNSPWRGGADAQALTARKPTDTSWWSETRETRRFMDALEPLIADMASEVASRAEHPREARRQGRHRRVPGARADLAAPAEACVAHGPSPTRHELYAIARHRQRTGVTSPLPPGPEGDTCARCRARGLPRHPALSRTDNRTPICGPCGTSEELRTFAGDSLPPRSEWPVLADDDHPAPTVGPRTRGCVVLDQHHRRARPLRRPFRELRGVTLGDPVAASAAEPRTVIDSLAQHPEIDAVMNGVGTILRDPGGP